MINRAFGAPTAPWVSKFMTSICYGRCHTGDGFLQKVKKLKIDDAQRDIVRAYLLRMIFDGTQEAET